MTGQHLIDGEFQSDKYPSTPRGKVPLSVKDKTAQDLLWQYAQRRREVDAEFSDDLEAALKKAGYTPAPQAGWRHKKRGTVYQYVGEAEVQSTETLFENDRVVVYRGDDGSLWVRPYHEFHDGRFERIRAAPPPTEDTKP